MDAGKRPSAGGVAMRRLMVATRATDRRCSTGGGHPPQRSEEWVA